MNLQPLWRHRTCEMNAVGGSAVLWICNTKTTFFEVLPKIIIDKRIRAVCPDMRIGMIRASVRNCCTDALLWGEIEAECAAIVSQYELLEVNKRPAVAQTRALYKALGKDPNRYRVASEALCRRVIRGLGLYRINALVDIINLVSLKSGYAISGLDADKIVGDTLAMGVGEAGENYEGIGRGVLNIEGLPVYRDAVGGVATPTSDEERTKISIDTVTLQMNINAFGVEMPLEETMEWSIDLLQRYTEATNVECDVIDKF